MAVQVDTIESLLVANVGKYIADMDTATAAFKRFKAEHGATSTANDDTAVEQSAARQTAVRRKQATDEAALAKTTADATKAAEKDKQAAIDATAAAIERARIAEEKFQATQSKRAETRFYAQGPAIFEAKAQEFSAADRLKDAQAAQVEAAAIREVAKAQDEAAAAEARYYATGPKVFEAKAKEFSAADRKAEAAAAREAAAAEAELTKAREADAVATARLAELEARLDANAAQRVIHDRTVQQSTLPVGGPSETGDRSTAARQTEIMAATRVEAEEELVVEKEINEAKLQQISNQARLTAARGAERDILKDMNLELRLMTQYEKEGLTTEAAAVRVEADLLAIEKLRADNLARTTAKQGTNDILRFGEAAGIGRTGGGTAAIAGLVAGAAVIGGAEAVKSATDYAKALSDVSKEAGLSTTALQVYQHAAVDAGAKSTDFDTAVLHLSDSLGRARTGSQEQAKVFAALGVDIKNGASAGELLPTLIDRISSIADQSKRARVEVALFGEGGEKLDGLLSGGNAKVNELAAALERTGAVLSSSDIAKLDDVSKKLESVKAQLEVDIAQVVAGNADAILSLAKAFAELAGEIGGAIKALDDFAARHPNLSNPVAAGAALTPGGQGLLPAAYNAAYNSLTRTFGQPSFGQLGTAYGIGAAAKTAPSAGQALTDSLNQKFNDQRAGGDFAPVQSGNVNNKLLDSLGAPKGRKGPDLERQATERQKYIDDTLATYQNEELEAQKSRTANVDEQVKISFLELDAARQKALDDIAANGKLKKLSADQIANLQKAANAAFDAKSGVITSGHEKQDAADALATQQQTLDFARQDLENRKGLAQTSAERKRIDLLLLDNARQAQDAADAPILADEARPASLRRYSDQQIAEAKARAAAAPDQLAANVASINRQDESPGQAYARSLKSTSDTIQDTEVSTLKSFNTELDSTITKSLHLHGIFGSIVDDLIDMAIKQALIKPLATAFFGNSAGGTSGILGGGSSGGGIGGLFGSLGKLFGLGGGGATAGFSDLFGSAATGGAASSLAVSPLTDLSGLFAFANGGSFRIAGNGGIDQNTLSINNKPVARVGQGETLAVIPQGQMIGGRGGPMTLQQSISIDARSSVTPADFAQQIFQASADHANRVAAQAGRGAVNAAPARVQQVQTLGNQ